MTPEQLDEFEKLLLPGIPCGGQEGRYASALAKTVKALREAWARCDTLRGLADEKAYEAGLYARRMGQAQEAAREARAEVERLKALIVELRKQLPSQG